MGLAGLEVEVGVHPIVSHVAVIVALSLAWRVAEQLPSRRDPLGQSEFGELLLGVVAHDDASDEIGAVPHALVWVALAWSLGGTLLLACVGVKLPGLEFHNQRVEAAYRKELVLGEDDPARAAPPTAAELFAAVRRNYFRLFFHYLYFDVVKWSYLQVSVLVPLIALGPTLIAGATTLGVMQQIARAFDKVLESFQFLVLNWSTVVEQISIYKRLRAFERQMQEAAPASA